MEIEIDSENESQLKRLRKPPLLLSQEESLAEKFKRNPCLSDKSQKSTKTETFFKNSPHLKPSLYFHVFSTFFRSYKTKITSCQTLRRPS